MLLNFEGENNKINIFKSPHMYKIGYFLKTRYYDAHNIVACITDDKFRFYISKLKTDVNNHSAFNRFLSFPVLCKVNGDEVVECIHLHNIPVYETIPTISTGFSLYIDNNREVPILLYNNKYFSDIYIESEYERRFVDLTLLRAAAVHQMEIYSTEMSHISPNHPDHVKQRVIKSYKKYIDNIDIKEILQSLYVYVSESRRCKIGGDDTYSILRTARLTDESIKIDDYLKDVIGIGERVCIYQDSGYTSVYNLVNYAEDFRKIHPIGEYKDDILERERLRIIAQYSKEEHMAYLFYNQLKKQEEAEHIYNKWFELKQRTDRDLEEYYHITKLDEWCKSSITITTLNQLAEQIQSEENDEVRNLKEEIPYNSIWYTTIDNQSIKFNESCNRKIISHKFINGIWILTFDNVITNIHGLFDNANTLMEITIPNSVTAAGIGAFPNCPNLKLFKNKFASEDGRCIVGDNELKAFASSGLCEYIIPNGITSIGDEAFKGCGLIKNISISSNVVEIGGYAFENCASLTTINIPNNVTKIASTAFNGCDKLRKFEGQFATADGRCLVVDSEIISFAHSGLDEYIIPNDIESIGHCAFCNCKNLLQIHLPSKLKRIDSFAFQNCEKISTITIPESVEYISGGVFGGCSSLKEFKGKYASDGGRCLIKDSSIIAYAEASGKTYVIPNDITDINNGAFDNCKSVERIIISDNTKIIGLYAFSNCINLLTIVLPNTIKEIWCTAFKDCGRLKEIYCKSIKPPKCDIEVFAGCDSIEKIYVPKESVDYYKWACGWCDYSDKIIGYDFE